MSRARESSLTVLATAVTAAMAVSAVTTYNITKRSKKQQRQGQDNDAAEASMSENATASSTTNSTRTSQSPMQQQGSSERSVNAKSPAQCRATRVLPNQQSPRCSSEHQSRSFRTTTPKKEKDSQQISSSRGSLQSSANKALADLVGIQFQSNLMKPKPSMLQRLLLLLLLEGGDDNNRTQWRPHGLFLVGVLIVYMSMPTFCKWVAMDTAVTSLLSWWYPAAATILLLHHVSQETARESTTTTNSASSATKKVPKRQGLSPLQSPGRRQAPTDYYSAQVTEWLEYWIVFGAVQATKRLLQLLLGQVPTAYPAIIVTGRLAELIFWTWIYVLGDRTLPVLDSRRPIQYLADKASDHFVFAYTVVADAVSDALWQTVVVDNLTTASKGAVFMGLLTQSTVDWLLHVATVFRSIALPTCTLVLPHCITVFGVAHVQYVVPLAQSAHALSETNNSLQQQQQWLKYWVLHALAQGVLNRVAAVLWWIPLSTHCIFILWCYLTLSVTVQEWYPALQDELRSLGLLPGSQQAEWKSTRTSAVVQMVLAKLPSARHMDVGAADKDDKASDDESSLPPLGGTDHSDEVFSSMSTQRLDDVLGDDVDMAVSDKPDSIADDEDGPMDSTPLVVRNDKSNTDTLKSPSNNNKIPVDTSVQELAPDAVFETTKGTPQRSLRRRIFWHCKQEL